MLTRIIAIFRRQPPRRHGIQDPYLAWLVDQSLGASAARIQRWEFDPETMTLDPETATREQLLAAYADCRACCAIEYPETEDGYGRANQRRDVLELALMRRFKDRETEQALSEIVADVRRRTEAIHGA